MEFVNPFEEYKSLFRTEKRDKVTRTQIEPAQVLLDVISSENAAELDMNFLRA